MKELMGALGKAQDEIKGMHMDGYNPFFSSRYTTLKLVLETIKPILRNHELVLTQLSTSEDNRVGVETILFHLPSGEQLSSQVLVPVEGKNPAQEAGKNVTYLRRYAISSMFNMYSDEDNDGNDTEQKPDTSEPEYMKKPKKSEPELEVLIKEYWNPLAAMADKMRIEFEQLPPDVTMDTFKYRFAELQSKVEGAK